MQPAPMVFEFPSELWMCQEDRQYRPLRIRQPRSLHPALQKGRPPFAFASKCQQNRVTTEGK